MRNIILVGNAGVGKSSVARALAGYLGYGVIDTDACITKAQRKSVADIFRGHGEENFREHEEDLLVKIADAKHFVVATGGGMPVYGENWEKLRSLGATVWLKTDYDIICQRFLRDRKNLSAHPMLSHVLGEGTEEKILLKLRDEVKKIGDLRSEIFQKSDFAVDSGFSTPEFCALTIRRMLTQNNQE